MLNKIFFSIIILFLFSCSSKEQQKEAKIYYDEALSEIKKGSFISAKNNLDSLESDFPYSEYTVKAEILAGFINYLNKDYDLAINAAEKFIRLRPANKYVNYMYYLKAEAYFQKRSDYLREQDSSANAKRGFLQLIARFPESKYTAYATEKLAVIANELANYNLDIARTHLKRGEYIPAILRLNTLLASYSDTLYANESRYRLIEAYYALGLTEQAKYEANILAQKSNKQNFWHKKNQIFQNLYLN